MTSAQAFDPDAVPDQPPASLRFRHQVDLRASLQELVAARAVVLTLAERDLRVRYKQAVLGFAWALLSPVVLLVAFTIIFSRTAHVSSGGAPYPLFSYLGILPWSFFSESVALGAQSIVADKALLNKVHFPREAFTLADVTVAVTDTLMAGVALVILFAVEGFVPRVTTYWLPVFVVITVAFATGVALLVSSLMVYFRDVGQALPIVLQLGLFATPVAYSFSVIPRSLQPLYAIVNPIGPVIDGLRRTMLHGQQPVPLPLAVGAAAAGSILLIGYIVFKRLEMGFADVA